MSEENVREEDSHQAESNSQKADETGSAKEVFPDAEHASNDTSSKSSVKEMEVHHHTHTGHHKKTWKEYFWEFFMLFLAVFCGFLAENFREEMVNHQREHGYMKSLVQDLKQDTAQLKKIILQLDEKIMYKDSLLNELANPGILKSSSKAYTFFNLSYHFPDFIYTDRTILQLKNSGTMLLIKNTAVSDSVMDYDSKVKTLYISQSQLNVVALTIAQIKEKLFNQRLILNNNKDAQDAAVPLLTKSREAVDEFYNQILDQKTGFIYLKSLDEDLLAYGTTLIDFIKKEYRLE